MHIKKIRSTIQTSSLVHVAQKNGEALPNDFILEGINHKVESLDLSMTIICDKEWFSCGIFTNDAMQLFAWHVERTVNLFPIARCCSRHRE